MIIGSILRFIVGLVLSAEIIRNVLFEGNVISSLALALSIGFIFLSIIYLVFRF